MKKNGFTLIEILVSIAIIALIFGIGIPSYVMITNVMKERSYQNKISYALSKAEAWANDTGRTATNIAHLIEEGYMEADNERGDYDNPVDDTSMLCYTIRIEYENNQYSAKLTEERYCLYEELEKQTSIIELVQFDSSSNIIPENSWTKSNVLLQVRFKDDENKNLYQDYVEEIEWKGNNNKSTVSVNRDFALKNQFAVEAAQFMDTKYEVTVKILYESRTFIYKAYMPIRIDRQKPIIYQDEIVVDRFNDWISGSKSVHVVTSDFDGSGVYGYYLDNRSGACSTDRSRYTSLGNRLSFDLSLTQGEYYACVMDNVGNVSDAVRINVIKTDSNPPTLSDFVIHQSQVGQESWYSKLILKVRVTDAESGANAIRYCITTGNTCTPTKIQNLGANGDVFLEFTDSKKDPQKICAIGIDNAGNQSAMKCSNVYKFDKTKPIITGSYLDENYPYRYTVSATDNESGIYKYQLFIRKDGESYPSSPNQEISSQSSAPFTLTGLKPLTKYFVKVIVINKSGLPEQIETSFTAKDMTPPILGNFEVHWPESSLGHRNWYGKLKLKIKLTDADSGVSGVYYCVDTKTWCNPETGKFVNVDANGYGYIPFTETTNYYQVACVIGVDKAGNRTSRKCSDQYLLDQTKPMVVQSDILKEDGHYKIDYKLSDSESGIFHFKISRGTSKSNMSTVIEKTYTGANEYYGSTSGTFWFDVENGKWLDINYVANQKYYMRIEVTNNTGYTTVKEWEYIHEINMDDAKVYCRLFNNVPYCSRGIYVQWQNVIFLLFKEQDNSVYGVSTTGIDMAIINDSCCDQGHCNINSFADPSKSGIWASGPHTLKSKFYDKFTNPTRYLNQGTFSISMNRVYYSEETGTNLVAYDKYKDIKAYFGLLTAEDWSWTAHNEYFYDISSRGTLTSRAYMDCNRLDEHWICAENADNIMGSFGTFTPGAERGLLTSVPAVYGNNAQYLSNAFMAVPFKKELKMIRGNGTKSNPYVIENKG